MKLSKLTCAVLSVIALSACGGGGGGGSSGSHNNQEEPQPIEETGVVVQDFQFNAFSSLDAAEVVTGGNFDSNSKTTVCLDLSHDNSCQDEQYSVSGTGLSFSNKLEWPEDLDVSGMNIIADNNNFVYSIPADSGVNDVAAQGTSVQKRIKVYINPASNALHADKLGKDVILGGYSGNKYSSSDFSAQKDYSTLDQEIITFADTLVSVLNYSNKKKLSYTEVRDIVSGALQKIIDALKDLSVSPVQIVVSVDTHNDYNHFANNGNPEVPVTNNPPVADFNFEVRADGVVKFSNNSSDPENDKLTYKWKFGDNAESDEASPNHTYKNNGKYTVYLNVTDPGNLSSYITKEVNVDSISEGGNDNSDTPVADENNAPIANFYYEDMDEGLVTFTNNSSDPDNDKLTYKWNFGDNSESNKKSPNHIFKKNGKYTVTLTVSDSHNLTSTITKDVIVASVSTIDPSVENSAPEANFSYLVGYNRAVTFINTSTDSDGDLLTSTWCIEGTECFDQTDDLEYTFSQAGTYKVTLSVSDGNDMSTITHDVIVTDKTRPDTPVICSSSDTLHFDVDLDVGSYGEMTFHNKSYDDGGNTWSYRWQFDFRFADDEVEKSFLDNNPAMTKVIVKEFGYSNYWYETSEESPQVNAGTKLPSKVVLIAKNSCGLEESYDVKLNLDQYLINAVCKPIVFDDLRQSLAEATWIGDVNCEDVDDGISVGLVRECQFVPDTRVTARLSSDKHGVSSDYGYGIPVRLKYPMGGSPEIVSNNSCKQIVKYTSDNKLYFDAVDCGLFTEYAIKGICVGNDEKPKSFDNNYLIINHKKSSVPLVARADEGEKIHINTVTTAAARVGVNRLLKNYTGGEYSSDVFSAVNDYGLVDDNIKVLGDAVFFLWQLVHYGRITEEELQTITFDGLGAIVDAKARGVTDDQILHNVVKYRDFTHLQEVQPFSNNRAPVVTTECIYDRKQYTFTRYVSASDPDNDGLKLDMFGYDYNSNYDVRYKVGANDIRITREADARDGCSIQGPNLALVCPSDVDDRNGVVISTSTLSTNAVERIFVQQDMMTDHVSFDVKSTIVPMFRVSDGKVFKFAGLPTCKP